MKLVNSFIFSFNKNRKHIFEVILTIVCCLLIGDLVNYVYVDDVNEADNVRGPSAMFEGKILNSFYQQEENIDNLYVGSSHVYCDVIPEKLDEINGKNNFNITSPGQPYIASYYLLKEVCKSHELSHVYLEMYYWIPVKQGDYNDQYVLTRNWDIITHMPFSFNKLEYMLNMSGKEYYSMTFLPVRRFNNHLFDWEYMCDNIRAKQSEGYKNKEYYENYEGYEVNVTDKGYWHAEKASERGSFVIKNQADKIEDMSIKEDADKYLRKIIEFCQQEGIEITLFASPIADSQLMALGKYDLYVEQVNAIAKEYEIDYYDFNLCHPKYMDMQDERYYINAGHLNVYGAELFTQVLGEVMLAKENGTKLPEDMFCATYEEKQQYLDKKIFGLEVYRLWSEESVEDIPYVIEPITTLEQKIEYKISKKPTEGEMELLQDWSENSTFTVGAEEQGNLYIEARPVGGAVTNKVQVNYGEE